MKYYLFVLVYLLSISTYLSQNTYLVFFYDKSYNPKEEKNNLKHENKFSLDFYDLPISKKYINELSTRNKIKSHSKWLNASLIYSKYSAKEIYANYPFIKEVVEIKNHSIKSNVTSVKNTASVDSNLYNFSFNQLEITKTASCLHNKSLRGDEITIAVLDAGFPGVNTMNSFARLRNENRIVDTWDFEDNLPFVYHKNNHGTYVSSIITGEIDSTFIGSAPNASFAFYITEIASFEKNIEEYNLVLGLERADSIGADIASISLGYRDFDTLQTSYGYSGMDGKTTIAAQGVKIARDKGMIIVVAAGNNGNNGVGSLVSPCDVDSILCVGATNYDSTRASFSSEGPTFDNRIKPDIATLGDSCYFIQLNDTANSGNGTSFATPLLSGMIACIKQAHPLRTNFEIMNAVRQSGHKSLNPDNILGYGIPNACKVDSILNYLDSNFSSINEITTLKASIYPNPTNNILNIKTSQLLSNIKVINSLGQIIISKAIKNHQTNYQINLNMLAKGNYYIEINSINGLKLTKPIFKL